MHKNQLDKQLKLEDISKFHELLQSNLITIFSKYPGIVKDQDDRDFLEYVIESTFTNSIAEYNLNAEMMYKISDDPDENDEFYIADDDLENHINI